jgi:hypothetical protein
LFKNVTLVWAEAATDPSTQRASVARKSFDSLVMARLSQQLRFFADVLRRKLAPLGGFPYTVNESSALKPREV